MDVKGDGEENRGLCFLLDFVRSKKEDTEKGI